MTKKRVYELAKELGISSKELITTLEGMKIAVNNHMSTIEDDEVKQVESYLKKNEGDKMSNHNNEDTNNNINATPKNFNVSPTKSQVKESKDVIVEEYLDSENITKTSKIKKDVKSNKKPSKDIQNKSKSQSFKNNESDKQANNQDKHQSKVVSVPETITVKDLALKINKPAAELIKKLLFLGIMATINQELDYDTAEVILSEMGYNVEKQVDKKSEEFLLSIVEESEEDEDTSVRPPVVTVMGHVDHGKTSLLDAIRHSNVTAKEAGGITQHIGAYTVNVNGNKVVFLDTPGHAAFTSMRARGAKVTDIAILVVAADDGVMPQTIEALNHAKAAEVPIIIAINKMDKPGANPDRVKQELTEHGILVEDWGGETISVPVSAHTQEGIDTLLEMIVLVSEMQELKATPNKQGKGTIIEAKLDKGRGPVATVLVQNGTLRVGDYVIAGTAQGRVRAMTDDKGKSVKKAGPSTPVEVLGFSDVPEAGDILMVFTDEKIAKQIIDQRKLKQREEMMRSTQKISLDDLFNQIKEGQVKDLNLIIKADVQGSVEAIKQSLERLSNDEVKVRPIHGGVGAITESDIMLASASNAIIIGFNVRPDANVKSLAEKENVDIRLYSIIYNAIEDIEAAMKGMLEPEYKETVLGRAEVRNVFKVSGVGTIGGSYVLDGKITRNSQVRIIRNGIVIQEGKIGSLKRFKDDAKEVATGYECGIGIDRYNDIKEGDIIEAFIIEEIPR